MVEGLNNNKTSYPHVGNLALVFFGGYIIIFYLQIGDRVPILGEIRFEFMYAAILTILALIMALKHRIELDYPTIKWAILLLLVIFIQVPLSRDFENSWKIFVDRVVKFSFMAFFITAFIRSPKDLACFLGAFLLACMKMGQEGLIGQLTGSMLWENQGIMRLHGSTPFYRHPNSFAGMALGTIPFILYLFPIVPRFMKVMLVVQLGFAFNIVLHTGSRTGYVGFLIMMLFIILKSGNKKKAILLIGVLTIFAFPFIDQQYVERFKTIYKGQEIEGSSMDTRIVILEDAVDVFLKNPFGVGIGAFPKVRQEMFGRIQDTHNLYLEVATNLGIQGVMVFLIFVWKMINSLNKQLQSVGKQKRKIQMMLDDSVPGSTLCGLAEKHKKDLDLIEATAKAVILFLILRLSLGLFGMDLYEIYWWFSIGLTMAIFNMNKIAEARSEAIVTQTNFGSI